VLVLGAACLVPVLGAGARCRCRCRCSVLGARCSRGLGFVPSAGASGSRIRLRRPGMSQMSDQACGCVGRSIGERFDPIPFVCGPISEVVTVSDVVVRFDDRCLGDAKKVCEFWMMVPSESSAMFRGPDRAESNI
jgi:hypothetical protein